MTTVAAVDLGSNSFHMVIGRDDPGGLTLVDRMREPVRLAAGLDAEGRIDEATMERALACLERFGQRLRDMPRSHVRAVGTNTFRTAKPSSFFLSRCRRALGFPLEVLPGAEEARLIYLGVSHDLGDAGGRRLVVDIGGGSTEVVVGERFETVTTDSLHMGCVTFSQRFFPEGRITRAGFLEAELAARLELEPIEEGVRASGWLESVGCSGTIKAVAEIAKANAWADEGIDLTSLRKLKRAILRFGSTSELHLPGMAAERAAVLPGGVAILRSLFKALGVERMLVSENALREGLLYDLVGRIHHEDVRERAIGETIERFRVDHDQGTRVERTAALLFEAVREAWGLDSGFPARALSWAARLHEVGLVVSHSGFHKHGEYLLANASMRGFSREDQLLLAALVRGHRRKVPTDVFAALPPFHREVALPLCVLLRLAVRLNRSRSPRALPPVDAVASSGGLDLRFPEGWLDRHPLTRADLEEEVALLDRAGFRLRAL